MIDISVRDLTKAFEVNNNILDGLTFQVQHGERVGILGRNGTGKTTLFRLMVGELTEDKGEIDIARGKRLGLVSQIPHYPAGYTVEDVLATAEERLNAMQARMRKLEELMAVSSDRALLSEYDELLSHFEMLGGYDAEVRRSKVANGLDIPPAMRGQLFDSLSGGEKTRVNLARLILEDTDILLLDEPTNHLDMHATEWLEDYLLHFKGTVLAISHDRWFLDKIAQRIIEIVNGKAEFYNGNYTFYAEEKQRRYEELRRQYEKNQKEIAHLQKAADDLHLWAFMGADKLHKRAFSMEKRIARLQTAERPREDKKLSVRFRQKEFFGDEVLVLEDVAKSYGEKKLFSGIDELIEPGERIALIGDNGTGKSTLLRCITGEETPDRGWIHLGPAHPCRSSCGLTIPRATWWTRCSGKRSAIRRRRETVSRRSASGARMCSRPFRCSPAASRAVCGSAFSCGTTSTFSCSTSRRTISIFSRASGWRTRSWTTARRCSS